MIERVFILRAVALSEMGPPLPELARRAMASLVGDSVNAPLLVLGTTLGCLETDREFDRSRIPTARYASPAAFSRTLPSTVAAQLALEFQMTGPALVVSAGDCSAAMALRRAAGWMTEFGYSQAIAGGFDAVAENSSTAATSRIGLVLLSTTAAGAIGRVDFARGRMADLTALRDVSLDGLMEWIANRGAAVALGNGVKVSP